MTASAAYRPPLTWNGTTANALPVYDFAEFPALIAWFKFNDGTGGDGTDINEMTGTITKQEIRDLGAGDPWVTPLALTTSNTSGAEIYSRHESGSTVPAKVRSILTKSLIVQCDIDITGGDNLAALIEIGNASNSSQRGVAIALNSGTGQPTFRAHGASDSTLYSVSDFVDMRADGRNVLTFVWNRNASTKGAWSIYKNGVLNGSGGQYVFAADPGTVDIAVTPGLAFGSKGSLGNVCLDATLYDYKWFYTSSIPTNIDTIVYDLAQNTNELPDSAKALTA